MSRIKVAIVDDDMCIHDDLKEFYENSTSVEVKYHFTNPEDFIKDVHTLDFDLFILDVTMPRIDGLSVAQILNNKKPVIFLTASEDKLADALRLNPIDVVTKPFLKTRLDAALEKARKLIMHKIDYALFNVAEESKKVKIHLPDIVFVAVDDVDPRNKIVFLKGCGKYTIMDQSFNELKDMASHLIQVNRQNLVSIEAIHSLGHDLVTIDKSICNEVPIEVTLSNTYKAEVSKRIFFK